MIFTRFPSGTDSSCSLTPAMVYSLMETKQHTPVVKVDGDRVVHGFDEVVAEFPLRVVLNGTQLVTLLCTPSELEELAVGFLLSEGILHCRDSIRSLSVSEQDATVRIELAGLPSDLSALFEKRTISSGCGKGMTFTNYRTPPDRRITIREQSVDLETIRRLLRAFRNISSLYLETGGAHSAALAENGEILFFAEDIGRHNAVDKLIGKAFLRSQPLAHTILLTSGRVTTEIMTKAGRNGIPVVISRAAPSCMAVSYAEDLGTTLIGFARGDRMNVYTWQNRIRLPEMEPTR